MVFTQHGAPGEYAYATIPPENDPGWMVAQGQNIDFSQTSNLTNTFCQEADYSGGGACLDATDFNFFQTTFTIPANGLVTSLILTMADVDDGVQVKIFNSAYPNGVVDPGAYVTLGGSGTSNLAQYIVPGVNRIVLTHVDDCVVNSALEGVTITLNGNPVNGC
jgi:hypothetical protein